MHKGFFLSTLEKLMKYWPGGSYLVLKITPSVPGDIPLMAIGYNYSYRKALGFIVTDGDGSTEPGDHYLSHFPEFFSNVSVCSVVCPHLLGRYFDAFNETCNHNGMR